MKQSTKNRLRWAVTILTFVALIGTCYALRRQIVETFQNLGRVNAWLLLLIIPLEAANYHAQANLYKGLYRILGKEMDYKFMYRLALELNFINNVFPSGGVSGFSYLSVRMRSRNISAAKSTLVQTMRFVLMFVSFQVLLGAGLLMLAIGGRASNLTIMVAASLTTFLFIATLIVGFVLGNKKRINGFFTSITRILNSIIHIVRPKYPETINISKARSTFTELHENYQHVKKNYRLIYKPLVYALLANVTEILVIYTVYVSFGHLINPGAVIIGYAIANFAGLVSVMPGGVGIYEALMTGVLATAGVPAGLSLPVTVMYRVLSMMLQLPPGYVLYQKALHDSSASQDEDMTGERLKKQ